MNLTLTLHSSGSDADVEHEVREFYDPGLDPILGPPYPPVNYQAFIGASPRVYWSMPDVFTNLTVDIPDLSQVTFYANNFGADYTPAGYNTALELWSLGTAPELPIVFPVDGGPPLPGENVTKIGDSLGTVGLPGDYAIRNNHPSWIYDASSPNVRYFMITAAIYPVPLGAINRAGSNLLDVQNP